MNFQPAMFRVLDCQPYPMVLPVLSSGETQRVFFTDFFGDADTNLVDVGHLARQESFTTGLLSNGRKHLRILVAVALVEHSNWINHDASFAHGIQCFGQRRMTRVVSAVRYGEKDLTRIRGRTKLRLSSQ